MGQIIKFASLVGLRPSDAVESVKLLNAEYNFLTCYNREHQALDHIRFPSVFLRKTKKAYISFVTPDILDIVFVHQTNYNNKSPPTMQSG